MKGGAEIRAGWRVLRRHLRYAGGNPRKLLWVVRRGLALARDGALGGTLERHLVEEGQYADYAAWCARHEPAADTDFSARIEALPDRPLFSILLPVWNPPVGYLREAIASVRAQCYGNWELCVVDDASRAAGVAECLAREAAAEPRIRLAHRPLNGGIARATNDALAMAHGEYCGFLDHDDRLAPDALLCMAEALAANPEAGLLYSDEDKLDADGKRGRPFFKPDWDGEWIRTTNYVLHFTVVRTRLLRDLGGLALGIDGAQDWDLVLRAAETVGRGRIVHVPRVLYHWRELPGSTAAAPFEKPAVADAQRRVIAQTLQRRAEAGEPLLQRAGWRIRYAPPHPPPLVSLVIPTRDHAALLRTCIESIASHTDYPAIEIVLVDNDSREPEARAYLAELERGAAARVVRYPHAFNYAAQCNLGVREARGTMIGLVNNDIEAVAAGWLTELVSLAARPRAGLAGATLYYPDGTLQHAGVVLGLNGAGDRPWLGTRRGFSGPYGRARAVREVSALITACAVVARDRYLQVGGMNEALAVSCNDLDLCMRLSRAGYHHVISPHAELVHHESASRGYADDPANARLNRDEEARFAAQWGPALEFDPLYNPNLSLRGTAYSLAWPPRSKGAR
ncbi:MAG: glycosyltransferase [Burkholderiales bacterium]|nr:glycosyltransferase [Burkholderiales bacterium]